MYVLKKGGGERPDIDKFDDQTAQAEDDAADD